MKSDFRVGLVRYERKNGEIKKCMTVSSHPSFQDARMYFDSLPKTLLNEPSHIRLGVSMYTLTDDQGEGENKIHYLNKDHYTKKEEFLKLEKEYNLQKK